MKSLKGLLLVFLTAILLSACANNAAKDNDNSAALIEKAKQTFSQVDALGYAWSEAEDMIKEAEAALLNAENDSAAKLAEQVIMHNELAMKQYEKEKNAGPL
ncbi:MAG: hypothetical protein OEY29_12585 [Gammaproteobacteria bacterium]|nr:hypothetical protein [Gammaproteobacteria bacterium]